MKLPVLGFLFFFLPAFAFADLKLTNRVTVQGRNSENTVLSKDAMIRIDNGTTPAATSVIVDCAEHKMIQLNNIGRTYLVTNMPAVNSSPNGSSQSSATGTVTLNIDRKDTGERQSFFGYKARHIKTTATTEGGSGACAGNLSIATDGWYIDAPITASCSAAEREILLRSLQAHHCADRVVTKSSGVETLGIPVLIETKATSGSGAEIDVRQETANIEVDTLDPALFIPPSDYTEVQNYRELIASQNSTVGAQPAPNSGPNFPPVTQAGPNENGKGVVAGATHATTDQKPGVLKIGITQVTSSTDQSLSVEGLQQELANQINFLGGRAVILAADPNDRDAANEQAKQQGCDYVLFTEITQFRTASVGQKLGSVLNRGGLGGVGGSGNGRVEIVASVKVFQPDVFVPALDGTTNFRGNDVINTTKGLMHTEARTVMLELKKLQEKK
ncbi:MAG TPA: hypothetical protein VJQ54_01120 [Candidatus Sulfotelmatobacter sp.]|nr:hypothetical protein [Candidatus Sulfotelmatobacter sp.]